MKEKLERDFLENNFYGDCWEVLKTKNSSIVNFSFIRNLFERKVFDKNFVGNRKSRFNRIRKNLDFSIIQDFVKKRYTDRPEKKTELFNGRNEWKDEFEKMVSNIHNENKDTTIKGLLARVYRLRNNYFHGEKDMNKEENELFKMANQFMIICLDSQKNI